MLNILEQLNYIFEHNDTKKDYYYIFVKRDIDNSFSHYIKSKKPLLGNSLITSEQDIYDYESIYMVDTIINTLDILQVRIYFTRKDVIGEPLNLNGQLSKFRTVFKNYITYLKE